MHTFTVTSSSDIARFRVVVPQGDGDNVALAADATVPPLGVTGADGVPAEGAGTMIVDGLARVECAGTVTRGHFVSVEAAGRIVNRAHTNHFAVGCALEDGVAGGVVRVSLGQFQATAT